MLTRPILLTVDELANALRARPETVRDWAAAGRVPARRVGRRWLFDPNEVARTLEIDPTVLQLQETYS
jgi:excisionase family DNA binding protein